MNTSVSPLPIPIWPLLGLSLALVGVTSAVVTLSAQHAAQEFRAQAPALDSTAPIPASMLRRAATERGRKAGVTGVVTG